MAEFAIVGAGLAGIRTAQLLTAAGHICLVFEKNSVVGGRLATHEQEGWQVDFGTQYFTARSESFKTQVAQWVEQKSVVPWSVTPWVYDGSDFEPSPDQQIRYVGYPKMASMLESACHKLDIYLDTRIDRLEAVNDKWRLWDGNGEHFGVFDAVILTAPLAQTLALIPVGQPLELQFKSDKMTPALTYAVAFEQPTGIDKDALFINNGIISWAARNSSKPGRNSEVETWVVHFSANWTANHLDASEELLRQQSLNLLNDLAENSLPCVTYSFRYSWLFAKNAKDTMNIDYWDDENCIGLAGDWTLGSRLEDAWLSAERLTKDLLTKY